MSVVLEGIFCDNFFSGKWKFTSQKTEISAFKFEKKSTSVPRDLLNSTSFIFPTSQKKTKETSLKDKRRFSSSSNAPESLNNPTTEPSSRAATPRELLHDSDSTPSSAEKDLTVPSFSDNSEFTIPAESTAAANTSAYVTLEPGHPLVGLYEGSFDLATVEGLKVIPETFFLVSKFDSSAEALSASISPALTDAATNAPATAAQSSSSAFQYPANLDTLPPPPYLSDGLDADFESFLSGEVATTSSPTATPVTTEASPSGGHALSAYTKLFGFGKACCEKKYLLSKYAYSKRTRTNSSSVDLSKASTSASITGTENNIAGNLDSKRRRIESLKYRQSSGGAFDAGKDVPHLLSHSGSTYATSVGVHSSAASSVKHSASLSILSSRESDRDLIDLDEDKDKTYAEGLLDEENCELYEGGMLNGKQHGYGISLRADGTMYKGQWSTGRESGEGELTGVDGNIIYKGEFLDGYFSGPGQYFFSNGDVYTGEWKEGKFYRGEYVCAKGCRYVGDFKDNKRHGKGTFRWVDGSYYEGEWENDQRHGRGVIDLVGLFEYDGNWAYGFPDGRGYSVFADGQEFAGSYKQGTREGRGSITFPEGAIYEGRFREDRFDGMGTIKITKVVPGKDDDELFIPIQVQADIKRIHLRAGFGDEGHGHH